MYLRDLHIVSKHPVKELKVYKAIASFDKYTLNRLKKFVASPYFNANSTLEQLLKIYMDMLRSGLSLQEVSEQIVLQQTKPNIRTVTNLRKLNSDLIKLIVTFQGQEELQNKSLQYNNLQLRGVSRMSSTDLIPTVKNHTALSLQRYPDMSSDYYFAKYEYEKIRASLLTDVDRKKLKAKIQEEINIDLISDALDQFYVIEKLKLYLSQLSWQRSYKLDKEVRFIGLIKEILQKEVDKDNKLIVILSTIVLTWEYPDKQTYFHLLRKQIGDYEDYLSIEDKRYVYDALINYCIGKINVGIGEFTAITTEVYKEALASDILLIKGEMSLTTFNNVVISACRNEEYDWAEQFVVEYASYLNANSRANSVSFSMARIKFYRADFEQVIDILREVEYETVFFNINSKLLLLFSYYEIGEVDALDSLINAFKVYLNREKSLSADRKKRYNQLLSFVKRIANVNPRDQKKIASIKAKLQDTKGVLNKSWLLDKLTELER